MTKDRTLIGQARRPLCLALSDARRGPLALLLASAMLIAGAAEAQTRERGQLFERLDTNGDGIADADELLSARREAFRRADKDGDGFVAGNELDALADVRGNSMRTRRGGLGSGLGRRRMPDVDERVRRLDVDGDGRISEAEFLEANNPLLERFDANGDGAISREEVERAQQRVRGYARQRGVL